MNFTNNFSEWGAASHKTSYHLPKSGDALERAEDSENFNPEVISHTRAFKSPASPAGGPSWDLGVEIRVKDNGDGIPPEIQDKIAQPFFTTKPTGSGKGLGLSLSYDIVKAHGGELKVESEEGEGSEFVIELPFV